jgi:hypothetical protein
MRSLPALAAVAAVLTLPAAAAAEVPVNHSPPFIDVNPPDAVYVGHALVKLPGAWSTTPPPGTSVATQWQDCDAAGEGCVPITGATGGVYPLQPADVGHTIRVQEIASNGPDRSAPVSSEPTIVVQPRRVLPAPPPVPSGPVLTGRPVLTGVGKRGQTLTTTPGTWSGIAPITFRYRWLRCYGVCRLIAGAGAPAYRLTKTDATETSYGQRAVVTVQVIATNPLGSARVLAAPGIAVDGPRATPTSIVAALDSAVLPFGSETTIGRLLAHRGYSTRYFSRRAGRVELSWALREAPGARKLASWHRNIRRKGWVRVKLRLTRFGVRRLRHARDHLTIATQANFTPARAPGGTGVGATYRLSATEPAEQV